jgi:hypothetical protein
MLLCCLKFVSIERTLELPLVSQNVFKSIARIVVDYGTQVFLVSAP